MSEDVKYPSSGGSYNRLPNGDLELVQEAAPVANEQQAAPEDAPAETAAPKKRGS